MKSLVLKAFMNDKSPALRKNHSKNRTFRWQQAYSRPFFEMFIYPRPNWPSTARRNATNRSFHMLLLHPQASRKQNGPHSSSSRIGAIE